MKKVRGKKKFEEQTFWQSYSDMMAAVLLVFVLIIAFTIIQAKVTYEQKEAELKTQNEALIKQNEEILEYKDQVKEQQKQLDQVVGIRKKIVQKLNQKFSNSKLNATVDPETGSICFDSSVLFDYSKYTLKKSGKKVLNEFFPKYFDVILSNDIKQYVSEVIIEGHTDNHGSYLYNLDLSQKRAFAVSEYCLRDSKMFSGKKLETVREMVTANGRSYYELKRNANGKVDANASRRVEIKFRLTEEEMIGEMSDILENK